MQAEDSCLTMASSGYYDDVFYCSVFEVLTGRGKIILCRLFEAGSFKGLFKCNGQELLCNRLGVTSLLPYHVYTAADILADKKRTVELYQQQRKPCT